MNIDPTIASPSICASDRPHSDSWGDHSTGLYAAAMYAKQRLPYLLIAVLLAGIYGRIFWHLAGDWYGVEDFSHGFLIPPFVAFLLWDQRKSLAEVKLEPTWQGLWLIFPALFLLMAGQLGAGRFLSRLSFVFLAGGLVWTLGGIKLLNRTKFIVLACLLALPLPGAIYSSITSPLQLLASRVVSDMLPLFGVPVLRTGNIIQLPALQLEVAQACSGIRSLMSLITLAIIFGYLVERTMWRRILLALASMPVAVASNVVRIFITGLCVQYWDPAKAEGFFHEFSGVVMFIVSLGCLYAVHLLMRVGPRHLDAA